MSGETSHVLLGDSSASRSPPGPRVAGVTVPGCRIIISPQSLLAVEGVPSEAAESQILCHRVQYLPRSDSHEDSGFRLAVFRFHSEWVGGETHLPHPDPHSAGLAPNTHTEMAAPFMLHTTRSSCFYLRQSIHQSRPNRTRATTDQLTSAVALRSSLSGRASHHRRPRAGELGIELANGGS